MMIPFGHSNKPTVRPLMWLSAKVQAEIVVPRGNDGSKLSICYFTGGEFHGDRLRGEVLPGGGDWAIYRTRDHLDIEVRGVLKTHDGAIIYLRYDGMWRSSPGMLTEVLRPGGGSLFRPEEHYLRVFGRFETAATRYAWLNQILALGVGTLVPDGIRYEFLEVL